MLYLDFYGPLHSTPDGYKHILTCKDAFSRFYWLIPTKTTKNSDIADALEKHVFAVFGMPDKLVSDNAKSFTSVKMKELCDKLNITLSNI